LAIATGRLLVIMAGLVARSSAWDAARRTAAWSSDVPKRTASGAPAFGDGYARMQPEVTDLSQLSQVISHATAPAFLLGAVAGFVSILITRMTRIIDRVRDLNMIADDDGARTHLKSDIPRLMRRARLMNTAIYLAVGSAICTTVLVILAFGSALVGIRHEPLAGVLFIVALGLLGGALFTLAREVRIGLNDLDHYG
jgi:hypothetical protein